jgi:lysophospholipase L1-like esterase
MRPLARRRLNFGLLTAAGLLLMAEAGVSVFGRRTLGAWEAPVPVTQTGAPYLPGNPFLLWEMVPGERQEMGVDVHINALGFRGPETSEAKPKGTRRVLILGDSTVYGHGVKETEVFGRRLDTALGEDVEVINLGTPGYSTAQSINLMAMRGWALEPDLVVIANLWSDNNFDSFVDKQLLSSRHNAGLSLLPALARVLQQSALYRWLDWTIRLEPRAEEVKTVGWMLGQTPTGGYRRVSVNDYAANLQLLVDEADKHGAAVAFVAFANAVDLGAETEGAIAWPLYRSVMSAVAKRNRAPLIEIGPAFEASGLLRDALFLDELHPSAEGHRLIAETLNTALQPWLDEGGFSIPASDTPLAQWDDPFARGEGPPVGRISTAQVTLSGSVVGAPEGIPVQIDLVDLDPDRNPGANPILGSARFDHVDSFEMPAPRSGIFGVRVYLDPEGDGPSAGDPMFSLIDPPIKATGSSIVGVRLNLNESRIEHIKPEPTSPRPPPSPGE